MTNPQQRRLDCIIIWNIPDEWEMLCNLLLPNTKGYLFVQPLYKICLGIKYSQTILYDRLSLLQNFVVTGDSGYKRSQNLRVEPEMFIQEYKIKRPHRKRARNAAGKYKKPNFGAIIKSDWYCVH